MNNVMKTLTSRKKMPVDCCIVFLNRLQKFFSAESNRRRLGMRTYHFRNDVRTSSMDNKPNSNILSLADITKIGKIESIDSVLSVTESHAEVSDNKDNDIVIKEKVSTNMFI